MHNLQKRAVNMCPEVIGMCHHITRQTDLVHLWSVERLERYPKAQNKRKEGVLHVKTFSFPRSFSLSLGLRLMVLKNRL